MVGFPFHTLSMSKFNCHLTDKHTRNALVTAVVFQLVRLEISCSSDLSTEDSVRNLDVFLGLCSQYFCTSALALKIEDLLYGSPSLKINILALLSELFSKCEGNEKSGVKAELARSKTSCSENGEASANGHDGGRTSGGDRSQSAPISR